MLGSSYGTLLKSKLLKSERKHSDISDDTNYQSGNS